MNGDQQIYEYQKKKFDIISGHPPSNNETLYKYPKLSK